MKLSNTSTIFKSIILITLFLLTATWVKAQVSLQLAPSNFNGFNINCFGGSNGNINLTISGGSPPYSIVWSTNDTTEDLSNLPAGYYRVVVDDIDTLTEPESAEITLVEPRKLDISTFLYKYANNFNISLYEACNGRIDLSAIDGVPPYNWLWNDNSTSQNRTGLCADRFSVTVTDINGCIDKNIDILLTQPDRSDWQMGGNIATDPISNFVGTSDSVDLVLKTNNTERIRIRNSGLIEFSAEIQIDSISTDSARMVYVDQQGILRTYGPIGGTPVQTPYWQLQGNNNVNESTNFIGATNVADIIFKTTSSTSPFTPTTERLRITKNGRVGIGTSTPEGLLELSGTNPDLYISNSSTNSNSLNFKNSDGFWHFSGPRSGEFEKPLSIFWNNNSTYTRIMSFLKNGTVAIGIDPNSISIQGGSTPYKLIVNGKLGAQEMWTSLGTPWPDYVFDKGYKYKSISELQEYVFKERHLPGMPSANEIELNDKINITETLIKQQEKLEEAYLYIFELKSEIDDLKKKMKK